MKTKQTRRPPSTQAPLLATGAAINFLILLILITFSYLREEPLFWRNEGGASIELRDLVATFYYPLLSLEFILLSAFTGFSIHRLSTRSSSASLAVILLPMLWGLYFMLIANSVFNNLENLFLGRPLHWHPDRTWNQLGGGPHGAGCQDLAGRRAVAWRARDAGSLGRPSEQATQFSSQFSSQFSTRG